MTIAQRIGEVRAPSEVEERANEFAELACTLMAAKGSVLRALKIAEEKRELPRVKEILQKAATSAGTATTWSQLATYTIVMRVTAMLANGHTLAEIETHKAEWLAWAHHAHNSVIQQVDAVMEQH